MPSVGPTEILLVLVIALLVLGPTKLPDMARQLGRGIRQFREAARNVTREMGAEDLVDDLKELNQARGTLGQTVRKELGLDELGPFPDISEIVDPQPATAQTPSPTSAVTAAVPAAAAASATGAVAVPPETLPADAAVAPVTPKPVRKRAPRAKPKAAEEPSADDSPAAAPKPARKRAPRVTPATPAAAPAEGAPAPSTAAPKPKPARARAAKAKTSEPA